MCNLYNCLLKLVQKTQLLPVSAAGVYYAGHKDTAKKNKHKSVLVQFLGSTIVFRKPGKHLLTHFRINL